MTWMSAEAARKAGAIDLNAAPTWPDAVTYRIRVNLDGKRALYDAPCGCVVVMLGLENPQFLATSSFCEGHLPPLRERTS